MNIRFGLGASKMRRFVLGLWALQAATNDLLGSKHIFLKTLDKSLSNACGPTCLSPIAFEYRFLGKKSILTGAFPLSPVPR